MDPRDRTIDELVQVYMRSPGSAESEQLDFKAKGIVESTGGKRDLAKKASAIANTKGGTLVVGVGEGDRDDILQSFGHRSEIKRDLGSVFRDNTKPSLDRLVDITIEELESGIRLLRIDIQSAERHPIEFYDRDKEDYVPYRRVADTTREMDTTDIVDFSEKRSQPTGGENGGLEESINIDSADINVFSNSPPRKSPRNRAILNIDEHAVIIPSRSHIGRKFQKSLTFHVETRAESPGLSGLTELLETASEELNASLGHQFAYGIGYRSKELIGRTADNYIDDIKNLKKTLRLLGGEDDDDPRPVAIGGTECEFGFVWFQAQYHTGSLSRIKCGLIMPDVPINTDPINRVFGEGWLQQNNALRSVRIRLRGDEVPLSNSREVLFNESGREARTKVVADNPLFRNKETILEQIEHDRADHFIDAICAVDRLPFDVRGGYSDEDVYHSVGDLHLTYVDSVVPAYFVWPICNPHTEAPSEDSPSPDFIETLHASTSEGGSEN